jgi:hypothetical protein
MNAAASVLGSVLAMVIAIQFGLTVTLTCGAVAYFAGAAADARAADENGLGRAPGFCYHAAVGVQRGAGGESELLARPAHSIQSGIPQTGIIQTGITRKSFA